ncbi:hypothetical protein ACIA8K_32675 [Catenuloplanes sp. NPDC051500]|uniref:hypothetical protein n=1 Tax=Catenuloplanes sp. NPDC051500 TaxID=3363959 RepID=UPI0037B0E0F0
MPATEPPLFKSATAFRASVDAHLKTRQRQLGPPTTSELLRRRFLQERLLARVFASPDSPWILKGGLSMLVKDPTSGEIQP